jgi:prepilin-type N-terminal cleavage/methylation domain-containing protein
MNVKQMKNALSRFRKADVSIIKDEKLRAKAHKLQAKQSGFTLLELLVVITLLATLATAALVAYDGIGENASDAAAANALISAESAVRNFRAVESRYPNQWDNLANLDGDSIDDGTDVVSGTNGELLAAPTRAFFGQWVIDVADSSGVLSAVAESLAEVGIDEFQTVDVSGAVPAGLVPNLAFNESGGWNASELELWDEENEQLDVEWNEAATGTNIALSIVPSGGTGTCTAGSIAINANFDTSTVTDSSRLNLINDGIGDEQCSLVIALGYGKDVPGTTLGSRVAIAQVPTTGTNDVNPSISYARAIALFQVGVDADIDGDIESNEIFDRPRLIGFVDPEGRGIDTVLAAANVTTAANDDD